jgi:hypothetical protein
VQVELFSDKAIFVNWIPHFGADTCFFSLPKMSSSIGIGFMLQQSLEFPFATLFLQSYPYGRMNGTVTVKPLMLLGVLHKAETSCLGGLCKEYSLRVLLCERAVSEQPCKRHFTCNYASEVSRPIYYENEI